MKKPNYTSLVILGTVPFLGATSRLYYALWMSVILAAVILLESLVGLCVRNAVNGRARWLICAVTAAGLSAAAGMLLNAYLPSAAAGIGICLAFPAMNCLVFCIFETTAENGLKSSVKNAFLYAGTGSGVLMVSAAVRELLQYGTVFSGFGGGEGIRIFADWFSVVDFAGSTAGALIVFGLIAALMQKICGRVYVQIRNKALQHEMIAAGCHPNLVIDEVTGKIIRRTTAEILEQRRAEKKANVENNKAIAEDTLEDINDKADAENDCGEVKE